MALIMFTPKKKRKKLSWRGCEKTIEKGFICRILIHSVLLFHSFLTLLWRTDKAYWQQSCIEQRDRAFRFKPLNLKVKAIYQRHWAPAWLHHTSLSNPNVPLTTRLKHFTKCKKSLVRCWCLKWPRTIWGPLLNQAKWQKSHVLALRLCLESLRTNGREGAQRNLAWSTPTAPPLLGLFTLLLTNDRLTVFSSPWRIACYYLHCLSFSCIHARGWAL